MADYNMFRGDTLVFDGVAEESGGDPQDLTGCTLWMTAKNQKSDLDADAVIAVESGSGIEVVSAAAGTFTVTIAATLTADLTKRSLLHYDVQLKDATGQIYTVDSGTITVELDITRATS
jgi:hypothetical protein